LHGTALSREAYDDAGGFDDRYDRFAESLLAVRLRNHGRRLGLAGGSVVRHHYRTTLGQKLHELEGLVHGESRYCDDHRDHPELASSLWLENGLLSARAPAAVCRQIAGAVGRVLLGARDRSLWRALARPLWHFSVLGLLGPGSLAAVAACLMHLAALRCY